MSRKSRLRDRQARQKRGPTNVGDVLNKNYEPGSKKSKPPKFRTNIAKGAQDPA